MINIMCQAQYKALRTTRMSLRAPVVGRVRGNSLRLAANALRAEPEAIAASAHANVDVSQTSSAIVEDAVIDTAAVGDGATQTGVASAAASTGDASEAAAASEAPPVDESEQREALVESLSVSGDQVVVSASHAGEASPAASGGDAPEAEAAAQAPPVDESSQQADHQKSQGVSKDQGVVAEPEVGVTAEDDAVSSDEPTTSFKREPTSVHTMTGERRQQRPRRSEKQAYTDFRKAFPYKVGDEVIGKVSWSNNGGAKVDIQGYTLLHGYVLMTICDCVVSCGKSELSEAGNSSGPPFVLPALASAGFDERKCACWEVRG
jgi:hypothetical protein